MKNANISSTSLTDWARVDALADADIDLADCPEMTPEMWQRAVVRRGLQPAPPKAQLTLRIDQDVLAWFQAQGRGYKAMMNALLRTYMEAQSRPKKAG